MFNTEGKYRSLESVNFFCGDQNFKRRKDLWSPKPEQSEFRNDLREGSWNAEKVMAPF